MSPCSDLEREKGYFRERECILEREFTFLLPSLIHCDTHTLIPRPEEEEKVQKEPRTLRSAEKKSSISIEAPLKLLDRKSVV